jgi:cell division protein FtsN
MIEERKTSPWVWLSLLAVVGLFAAFILYLDQQVVNSSRDKMQARDKKESQGGPVIDFYTVLQDRRVDVPERPAPETIKPNAPTATAADQRYILQAGSFRKAQDADRRKAELALLGLEAAIKKAVVAGEPYFRVELGPFSDDGFYSQVKNRLISNKIQYIARSAD